MAVLRSLVTTLGLNAAQFRQELQRSRQDFGTFTTNVVAGGKVVVGGVKTVIDQVFSLRSALIALGTGAALAGIKSAYESLDETAQLGRNIGIAAGQWHAYAQAAEWAGSNGEKLADVIKDLNVKIADTAKAGGSSGPLADFFTQIGESAAEWSRLSPDEQLRKFTAELQNMSGTDARFYLDELNDSAAELYDTLYTNQGQLFAFVDEINRSGMALTDGQFAAVREARLEIERLTSVMGALWEQVKASLAPAVAEGSKLIRTWITDSAEAKGGFAELGQGIALYIIEGVERASRAIKSMMDYAEESFRKIQMITGAGVDDATRSAYWQAQQDLYRARQDYYASQQQLAELQSQGLEATPILAQLGEMGMRWEAAEQRVQQFLGQSDSSGWDTYFANLTKLKEQIVSVTAGGDGAPTVGALPPPSASPGAVVLPDTSKSKSKTANYGAVDAFRAETAEIGQELAKRQALLENAQATALDSERQYQDQRAIDIQTAAGAAVIDEATRYAAAQQRLQQKYAAAFDAAAANHDLTASLQVERYAALEQLEQDHQARLLQIEQDRVAKQRAYQQQVSQELLTFTAQQMAITTSALQEGGKEQTALYKMLFAAQKLAAIPAMVVATEEGATKALELGPIAGPIASNAIRALGYASVGIVSGQAIAGMAHDGIDNIPNEGTWLLDKGERVVDSRTNADLKAYLASQGGTAAGPIININEDASRAGTVTQSTLGEQDVIDIFVAQIRGGGAAAKAGEQTYGWQRKGR